MSVDEPIPMTRQGIEQASPDLLHTRLLLADPLSGEHSVDAYLARLTSPASRRVQASALETIARRIAAPCCWRPIPRSSFEN